MGQQPCAGGSPEGSQDSSEDEEEDSDLGATAHAREVRDIVALLAEKHAWKVSPEVEECIANTELPAYREILRSCQKPEPRWDESVHGAYRDDKRVRHLATGGCVFEKLSVYVVLAQLLYPAIVRGHAPRVLDVGCGTGFLTSVLARLVAPRGGSVVAIDLFSRQIQNARQTMASVCPELLPHVDFQVANGWDYRDPRGTRFAAIAVAAQATEVPEGLVEQLAPNGRLVLPLGGRAPTDRIQRKVYRKYWMIEKGMDGTIGFSGRAGPINVNFVPFLPPAPPSAPAQQPQQQRQPRRHAAP